MVFTWCVVVSPCTLFMSDVLSAIIILAGVENVDVSDAVVIEVGCVVLGGVTGEVETLGG